MMIIVALGNPGQQYEWTKHNLGWLALDAFLAEYDYQWEKNHKAKAIITKLLIKNKPVLFVKPQTFMNDSGQAVRDLMAFYKLSIDRLLVVHDDIDLEFGRFKVSKESGSAGHKGVQSIIDSLGSKDFTRLRLGIKNKKFGHVSTDQFVLQPFSFFEKRALKKWFPEITEALKNLIK